MLAKIWFPERQVLEEHDVDIATAEDPDDNEFLTLDEVEYVLTPSRDDPNADFMASRKGVA